MKTLIDFNKIKYPHTHDLKDLIDILDDNKINPIKDTKSLLLLTQYAVDGRYAVIHDDLDDADKYIGILEELLLFTKEKLKKK